MATSTLTTGTDTIVGTSGDDTVNGTSSTLNASDSLDGGTGHDMLALFGSGSFDLSVLAQFTAFELVQVNGGGYSLKLPDAQNIDVDASAATGSGTVTLGSGVSTVTLGSAGGTVNFSSGDATVTGNGGPSFAFGGAFNLNFSTGTAHVNLTNASIGSTFNFSSGAVTLDVTNLGYGVLHLGTGSANVTLHGNNYGSPSVSLSTGTYVIDASDTFNSPVHFTASSYLDFHAGDVLIGSPNLPNTLTLSGNAGTYDLSSLTINNVPDLVLSGATLNGDGGANHFSSVTGNGTILYSGSTADLSNTTVGQGVQIQSTDTTGTTFTVKDAQTALDVVGGPGGDTIIANGFALTAAQRAAIFELGSVETITDINGTYTPPPLFRLTPGNDTFVGTGADETVVGATASTLHAGDQLDGGAGTDTLALFGSGTFDLTSLAQFTAFELVQVNGGGYSLKLPDAQNIDVDASAATGSGTVTLGSGVSTVTLGSAGGTVNFSSGDATVTGNGGPSFAFGGAFNLNFSTGTAHVNLTNASIGSTFNFSSGAVTLDVTNLGYGVLHLGTGSANVTLHGNNYGSPSVSLSTGTYVIDASDTFNSPVHFTASSYLDFHAGDVLIGSPNLPNTLTLSGNAGTYDLSSLTINNVPDLVLSGATLNGDGGANHFSSVTGNGTILYSGSTADLSNTTVGQGVQIQSTDTTGTTFTVKGWAQTALMLSAVPAETRSSPMASLSPQRNERLFSNWDRSRRSLILMVLIRLRRFLGLRQVMTLSLAPALTKPWLAQPHRRSMRGIS